MLTFLLRWWWPVFAFVYPLLWWPFGKPSRTSSILLHIGFTLLWVLVGLVFELAAHPETRFGSIRQLPGWFRRNPAALIAVLYGAWALFAAAFSPDPAAAYVGSAYDQTDGATWVALLVVVFLLGYIRTQQDAGVAVRVAWGVVWACAILAALSLWEVVMGHGVFYPIQPVDAPTVNFPQKGHLAGMLVMGAAAALALPRAWPLLILIGIALGTTVNRAAFVALAVVAVWQLWQVRRAFLLPLTAALIGIGGGWAFVHAVQGDQAKEVASGGSLMARSYFWRIAWDGIKARPVFGWGGGNFYRRIASTASPDHIRGFMRYELGEKFMYTKGEVIVAKGGDGKIATTFFNIWKSHNELLEQAIMYGLPGLVLFIALIFASLHLNDGKAHLISITLAYIIFTMLWFQIIESQAVLWIVLGCNVLKKYQISKAQHRF